MDIIVPTFINCHLFWIIPKKNLLIRSAINRFLKTKQNKQIKDPDDCREGEMVAIIISDACWTRAIMKQINKLSLNMKQFVCWLPDYGVMQAVNCIYYLPEELKKVPHLSKQASLCNVVNLTTDLVFSGSSYTFQLKKTVSDVQGVARVALDCIEEAKALSFSLIDEDEINVYGDIILLDQNNKIQSLTDYLVEKQLLEMDKEMFKCAAIQRSRMDLKNSYFEQSHNWQQKLDRVETKYLDEIIFNRDENIYFPPMEFFERKPFNDDHIMRPSNDNHIIRRYS